MSSKLLANNELTWAVSRNTNTEIKKTTTVRFCFWSLLQSSQSDRWRQTTVHLIVPKCLLPAKLVHPEKLVSGALSLTGGAWLVIYTDPLHGPRLKRPNLTCATLWLWLWAPRVPPQWPPASRPTSRSGPPPASAPRRPGHPSPTWPGSAAGRSGAG
jgi:hypothetical protein